MLPMPDVRTPNVPREGREGAGEYSNAGKLKRPRIALRAVAAMAIGIVAATTGAAAQAQSAWAPMRPVQLVVPYPAGGGTDALARMVGQRLALRLGQPVVVENRPGAGANIGTEYVARAEPDGHTLLMVTAPNAIAVTLYPRLHYDLLADFAPIAPLAATQFLVVVHPGTGIASLPELIARAKERPARLNFGSSGNGTVPHLAMELIKASTGGDLTHVPYKGAAPAIADLLAGQVQVMAIDLSLVLPHVRSGKLRGLAVTGSGRAAVASEFPTVAEAGVAGYEILSWYGVIAPVRAPAAAVMRLNQEITRIMSEPEIRERLIAQGTEPRSSTPAEYGAFLRAEVAKFARLVKASGAKVD